MEASKHLLSLAALCFIGAALVNTGCVKNDLATSNDLQFSAESTIATKAVYGADAGEYQRIIWQSGDEVTIASDQAQTLWGRKFCDYTVTPMDGDASATTRQSQGKISRKPTVSGGSEDSGLRWNDNAAGSANFWSVYPATTYTGIESGTVQATIPASTSLALSTRQPGSDIVKILDPVNGSYPMVAHATANANTNLVKLQYYPAFTAFQITLYNGTEGNITLSNCSLSSTSSDLSGTFTASIDALATDAPSNPVLSNLTGTDRTVSVGIGQVLSNGQGVTFSIFCLPQTLTDLTFNCTYVDANGEQNRSLALKQYDEALTFDACKQHRMSLTLTKSGGLNFEITEVIKIILANAFPNLFDYSPSYGDGYQLYHHGTSNRVTEEEIRAAVLNVTSVTLSQDYGVQGLDYTAEDMSAFVNLETFILDNVHTVANISIDGLPHFTTFDMLYADNIHNVSITNCPMTETVTINSQSLSTLYFENLTSMKYLTINEGTANSNLASLTVENCPDLEIVDLGEVGKLEEIDLSGCSKMTDLSIGLATKLEDLDLSGCTALKNLYINQARSLTSLDTDDCTSIESIVLTNPQNLLVFRSHSTTLKELKFIASPDSPEEKTGSQSLVTLELDTPALATLEFCNLQSLANLTLSNLPASVTNFGIFTPVKDGTATSRNLSDISITGCNGFTNITIDPAEHVSVMHFTSCSNLQSVSLNSCNSCNVWAWPSPTTSVVATKKNCPSLNSYYTVNNYGTVAQYDFTNE
jgi:hypothetical protein